MHNNANNSLKHQVCIYILPTLQSSGAIHGILV